MEQDRVWKKIYFDKTKSAFHPQYGRVRITGKCTKIYLTNPIGGLKFVGGETIIKDSLNREHIVHPLILRRGRR